MIADIAHMLVNTIGGLALFLYGMSLMSDGLKKAAGEKMRSILESMTRNPVMGFGMGAVTTAIVQSSSATTVMIIGLVNAGLMSLRQAICVVFGTNVGTTATAWIVSLTGFKFKIASYALPIIACGFLIDILCKSRKNKSYGQILIGFGILFIGIGFMKDAFVIIKDNPAVNDWLAGLADKPVLALIGGTLVTMLLQSSSASIAIIQTLAVAGAFGDNWENAINVAIPFVLGCNIGTTITAQIASLRTNLASRRTAWAHTMFNVSGSLIALPFVYVGLFGKVVYWLSPWEQGAQTVMLTIAVAHTLFNVVNSLIFLPFAGVLEKVVVTLVRPRSGEHVEQMVVLEKHLLDTPSLALQQARSEIIRMAKESRRALESAADSLMNDNRKAIIITRKIEDTIDDFQHEITSYLVELSQKQLDDDVSNELPVLLHMVNDIERIGDHTVNIAEIAERKIENRIIFSSVATDEANEIIDEAYKMIDNIIRSLSKNDPQASRLALSNEEKINKMQIRFRRSHIQRLTEGTCSAEAGLIYVDLVDNIEKIGDHLTNIAQSVIGGVQWAGVESNTLSGEFKAIRLD